MDNQRQDLGRNLTPGFSSGEALDGENLRRKTEVMNELDEVKMALSGSMGGVVAGMNTLSGGGNSDGESGFRGVDGRETGVISGGFGTGEMVGFGSEMLENGGEAGKFGGWENRGELRGNGRERIAGQEKLPERFELLKEVGNLPKLERKETEAENKFLGLQEIETPDFATDGEILDRGWMNVMGELEKKVKDPYEMANELYQKKTKFLLQRYNRKLGEK